MKSRSHQIINPKISVIIPCYNYGRYVEAAVDSVLASTFYDYEIIIVNDGSTDTQTIEILSYLNKPKTRVINQANQGLSIARNNGIKVSRGQYFLPLDDDDTIEPT
jgi:glycosyltransferase involved in cell wall biosynthesis